MKDEQLGEAAAATPSAPAPQRAKVQFRWLRKRSKAAEFMHVDEALDYIGARLFLDEWGRDPLWKKVPFEIDRRRAQLVHLKWNITYRRLTPIKIAFDCSAEELDRAKRICVLFLKVRRLLKCALRQGNIGAAKLLLMEEVIEKIDNRHSAMWDLRPKTLFTSGYNWQRTTSGDKRTYRLLIERGSLIDWTDSLVVGEDGEVARESLASRPVPRSFLKRLAPELRMLADQGGYQFTYNTLLKILNNSLSPRKLTSGEFNNLIKDLPMKQKGRQKSEAAARFNADLPEIEKLVRAASSTRVG